MYPAHLFLLVAVSGLTSAAAVLQRTPTNVAPLLGVPEASARPAGFKNTVFNTDALQEPGSISHTWEVLSSHGVSQFIAFALYPMWNTSSYTHGKRSPKTPVVDAHQFRMIGGVDRVSDAIALITNPKTAPQYLELFNEPDLNKLNPKDAAKALEPLFRLVREKKTKTTLVGSPLAASTADWSTEFYEACNGCRNLIPIQGVHSYHVDPKGVLADLAHVHKQFPEKRLWLTETSPATVGNSACHLTEKGVIDWMKTAIPAIAKTGYVDKVFWNRGTYKVRSNAADNCDTSLVDAEGNPRQLLLEYQKL